MTRKIAFLNFLPLVMFGAAIFLLVPSGERGVLLACTACISVLWAGMVYAYTGGVAIFSVLMKFITRDRTGKYI